jgi:hypothetical protein
MSLAVRVWGSGVLLVLLIAAPLLYLSRTLDAIPAANPRETTADARMTVAVHELARIGAAENERRVQIERIETAVGEFAQLRRHLTKRCLAPTTEADPSAEGLRISLSAHLLRLQNEGVGRGRRLSSRVNEYSARMNEAVGALAAGDRVVGNALFADAQAQGATIERELAAALRRTRDETTAALTRLQDVAAAVAAERPLGAAPPGVVRERRALEGRRLAMILLLVATSLGWALVLFLIEGVRSPLRDLHAEIRDLGRGPLDLTKRLRLRGRAEPGRIAAELNALLDRLQVAVLASSRSWEGSRAGAASRAPLIWRPGSSARPVLESGETRPSPGEDPLAGAEQRSAGEQPRRDPPDPGGSTGSAPPHSSSDPPAGHEASRRT